MTNIKRKPSLLLSLIPLITMLVLLGVGYGYYKFKAEPLLIISAAVAAFIALYLRYTWTDILNSIVEKFAKSMPATMILITVGLLIGSWIFSGTIPMMIYYGIKVINPKFIFLTAFLVTAVVSSVTGTSWGSVGTIGVALIGIAQGLGVSLPIAAGAIVAGSYFGDKMSPLSDTTNLAPISAGSNLYDHIKHMVYTTAPGVIISIILYTVIGLNGDPSGFASPERINVMLNSLGTYFKFGWYWIIMIIPVLVVVYGSIKKLPTIPVMLFSALIAVIIGVFVQGFTLKNGMLSMVNGFNVEMISQRSFNIVQGFDPKAVSPDLLRLLNRGGMNSMMGTVLLALCAFGFAGVISVSGSLEVLLEHLLKFVRTTGTLILSTVVSCVTIALVTGSSYLSILLPGELFSQTYAKRGLAAVNLSRTLEDAGTVVVPLIPYSMAGAYMAQMLGVSVIEYAPWAFLCYTGIIFAIIYGFTGFGIKKIR